MGRKVTGPAPIIPPNGTAGLPASNHYYLIFLFPLNITLEIIL
jgi:hypothetical protein